MKKLLLLIFFLNTNIAFGQYLERSILINENAKRFYKATDIGVGMAGSPSNNLCVTKNGDIFLADDYTKVAAFKFSAADEDTVFIGYSDTNQLKRAVVLSRFSNNLLQRTYCMVKSNKNMVISQVDINEKDSLIALVAYYTGDTLYPDCENKTWFIQPEDGGLFHYVALIYDFNFKLIDAKKFPNYSIRGLIKNGQGATVYGQIRANDSIELYSGNYWVNKNLTNVEYFYLWDTAGNFKDFIYSPILEKESRIVDYRMPLKMSMQLYSGKKKVFTSLLRGELFSASKEDINNSHYWNYFVEMSILGEIAVIDSIETHKKYSSSQIASSSYYFDELLTQVLGVSDSISIFRGKTYTQNQNDQSGELFLRNIDYTEYRDRPFLKKTNSIYYSAEQVNMSDSLSNFAFNETYHGANYKSGTFGYSSDILTIYDEAQNVIWSRSLRYNSILYTSGRNTLENRLREGSIFARESNFYIYGIPLSDKQDLHPDINGNPLITPADKVLCIYNCRPISYFRALPNDSFKVVFHNLSDMRANFLWDFGDGSTSTEESPTHTFPTKNMWYTVTLYAEDDCGKDTFSTEVYIDPVRFSNVPNFADKEPLLAYPNPAKQLSELAISYPFANEKVNLFLYDTRGVLIDNRFVDTEENTLHYTLPAMPPGVYLMQLLHGDVSSFVRIVVY